MLIKQSAKQQFYYFVSIKNISHIHTCGSIEPINVEHRAVVAPAVIIYLQYEAGAKRETNHLRCLKSYRKTARNTNLIHNICLRCPLHPMASKCRGDGGIRIHRIIGYQTNNDNRHQHIQRATYR